MNPSRLSLPPRHEPDGRAELRALVELSAVLTSRAMAVALALDDLSRRAEELLAREERRRCRRAETLRLVRSR